MKTALSFIILCGMSILIAFPMFAQDKFDLRESNKRHEISIGVADIFSRPEPVYNYPYFYAYDMAFLSSSYYPYYSSKMPKLALKYKFNFGKLAIRSGFDFSFQQSSSDYDGNDLENKNTQLYGNFKLGADLHKNFQRVQLYYGMDIYYIISVSKSEYEVEYVVMENDPSLYDMSNNENVNTLNEYGVSPFIGVKYFINENLSLGAETNYMVGFLKNEYESKYLGNSSKNWNEGISTRFGPVGIISLNVHF